MLVGDFLTRSSKWRPDKSATVFEGVRLTYSQLNRRTNAFAHALLSMGVTSQDRIALICHNSHNFLEAAFAAAKIGAVSANLNWRLSAREMAFLIEDAEADVVILSKRFEHLLEPLLRDLGKRVQFITIEGSAPGAFEYEELISGQPTSEPEVEVNDEDVVFQIYTSGTTGRPKGVMLTHKNIVSHAMNTIIELEWGRGTRYLAVLPQFHIVFYSALNCVFVGGTIVFLHKFDPQPVLSAIQEEGITRMTLTPVMFRFLLDYPEIDEFALASLETISYATAPMPVPLLKRSLEKFNCKFWQTFGMTELCPTITILPPEEHVPEGPEHKTRRLASIGRPMMNLQVKIVDDSGNECPPGVIGEIIAKGDTVMKGYHKMPDATAEAIRNGWYHTGDMAYRDKYGYCYIADRKKDMIISGGENIYPKEVENAILKLEGVVEAAVIGVPDDTWGESVKAFVVKRPGSALTEEMVIEQCKATIAGYKKPKIVEFVAELPRNALGKLLKHRLREEAWTGRERKV